MKLQGESFNEGRGHGNLDQRFENLEEGHGGDALNKLRRYQCQKYLHPVKISVARAAHMEKSLIVNTG
jgi:hypothetical protein